MSCPKFLSRFKTRFRQVHHDNRSWWEELHSQERAARPIGPAPTIQTLSPGFLHEMGGPQFHKRLGEYLRAWPRLRHPQFQVHDKDYHQHVECGHTLLGFRWSSDPKSNHHLHSEKANYVYSSSRYYKLWHKRWWPCRLPWSYSLHRRLLRRSRFLRGLKNRAFFTSWHISS